MLEDTQLALRTLHDSGLVFGDVRRPNIMVVKTRNEHGHDEWHARLVDFDWSGPVGKVFYPRHLSGKVQWPKGACDFEPITKEHDHAMADKFFKVESDDIRCNCGP